MKKILILFSFILLTGCSAKYNLSYYDNILKEEFIVETSNNEYCGNDLCKHYINSYYNTNISINYFDSEEDLALNEDLSNYTFYNKSLIDSNNKYGFKLGYDYNEQSNYTNSYLVRSLFNKFIVNDESINAYEIKNIFNNYSYLDNIVISFKTDKYITNTNCDEVKDDTYYWYINKNNYSTKTINIIFDVDTNRENELIKDNYLTWNSIKYILLIIIVLLLFVVLYVYEKVKKSNK